ncbi:MAG: hypothetical protein ACR2LR_19540 [Hassallia sp.]
MRRHVGFSFIVEGMREVGGAIAETIPQSFHSSCAKCLKLQSLVNLWLNEYGLEFAACAQTNQV